MSVSHICNELILERTIYASVSGTLISMELNSSTRLMYHIAIPIFVSCKYIYHMTITVFAWKEAKPNYQIAHTTY